jgi:hypothetical protein
MLDSRPSSVASLARQACDQSDIHAAIHAAFTEHLSLDASDAPGAGVGSATLRPAQLQKVRAAMRRREDDHAAQRLPEAVDSRALQPALKVIANVERDPVLYNTLLLQPLIKDSKPQTTGGKKHGSRGAGRRRVKAPLDVGAQLCHVLKIGLRNRSLHTLLLGIKALLCLYESALADKAPAPALPQASSVVAALASARLPSWDDYLELLDYEEAVERAQRVTGKPIRPKALFHQRGCMQGSTVGLSSFLRPSRRLPAPGGLPRRAVESVQHERIGGRDGGGAKRACACRAVLL